MPSAVREREEEEPEVDAEDSGEPASKRARVVGQQCAIASPLAGKKLTKRVHKLVGKAAAAKVLRRGVKEVVKALRKGEKGLCVLAGDISPVDVISHIPVLCEDCEVPYVFVASKADLGAAAATKRPTSVVLLAPAVGKKAGAAADKALFESDKYKEAFEEIQSMQFVK
jgi:H/ACA ribonucleoprotein complex subunit 2